MPIFGWTSWKSWWNQWLSAWFHQDVLHLLVNSALAKISGNLWPRSEEGWHCAPGFVGHVPELRSSDGFAHYKTYKTIYIITFINALVMILRIHINPSFFYMFQVYKSNFPPVFPWITDGASLMPCCSGCEKLQLHPHLLLCAQAVGLCQSARLFAPGSSTTGERSKLLG